MSYVLRLREIKPDQYDLIGPLARNIVNVHNIGLSTPVGFCVTNLSFKNFLTMLKNEIDEYLKNINKEKIVHRSRGAPLRSHITQ
jgi:phosphoenolpyruvate synthase/pyruvate phosphate dikinase